MKISVTSGIGTGETTLSAFDSALQDAGVYNYNLIKLSSVIPPNSEIIVEKVTPKDDTEFGHRLYIVCAEERSDLFGHSIAAGIGWYQWGDGRGVFAEHHDVVDVSDAKEAENNVAKKLKSTVKDLCEFRKIPFDESKMGMEIAAKEVIGKPTCALVIAVYKSSSWEK